MKSMLESFLCQHCLDDNKFYDEDNQYPIVPLLSFEDTINFVDKFPSKDSPSLLGFQAMALDSIELYRSINHIQWLSVAPFV
jgi:hypothetical protein